ncbi:MAG: class I SAM-dependent methyltransferase [Clostridiales bacterium]|nr:class I SAM-dependent methyltransferase [Clostridiales bacterium]
MSDYGEFARFYDSLTDNVEYDERCDYVHKLLRKNGISDGILLDLACGTGSFSVRMAERGFEVIGVDSSCGMLAKAQEKAMEHGKNILFLCQDMCQLDLFGTVKATICMLDSINHLTSAEDVLNTFKKVSLFTEPGGLFIFDANTVYKHRKVLADNTFVYDTDDVYCVWQNKLQRDGFTTDISLDFFYTLGNGRYGRSGESFSEKAYPLSVLEDFLSKAGFEVVGIYNELTENKPDEKTERAVFTAKKI